MRLGIVVVLEMGMIYMDIGDGDGDGHGEWNGDRQKQSNSPRQTIIRRFQIFLDFNFSKVLTILYVILLDHISF